VLDQKYLAIASDDDRAHANGKPTGESPIKMQEPPDDRLEQSANGIQVHTKFAAVK
jgi:hypothetical protein